MRGIPSLHLTRPRSSFLGARLLVVVGCIGVAAGQVSLLFGGGEFTGGARQMEVQPLEVYATDSNYAVVKPPGREFPGAVVQGDSLRKLCGLATGIATWFRDSGPTDDPEVLGDVQELTELLVDRLMHYQRVLEAHSIRLPYSRPVTEADGGAAPPRGARRRTGRCT